MIEGTYRGNKKNGVRAIHFFDEATQLNGIFNLETGEFINSNLLDPSG